MINPKMSTMIVPIIPSVGSEMSAMPTMLSTCLGFLVLYLFAILD
jgi:hypothetical protein